MSFQEEVGEWGNVQFPMATSSAICAHLKREVAELDKAAYSLRVFSPNYQAQLLKQEVAMEAADCYMLLLHLCFRNGIDLETAAREKFEVNKARTWGKPDAEGVVEHVREGEK